MHFLLLHSTTGRGEEGEFERMPVNVKKSTVDDGQTTVGLRVRVVSIAGKEKNNTGRALYASVTAHIRVYLEYIPIADSRKRVHTRLR